MIATVIDLETTGLDIHSCDILELGLVKIDLLNSKILNTKSYLINPYEIANYKVDAFISSLTGITTEMIVDHGRSYRKVLTEVLSDIQDSEYLIGHNLREYDLPILKRVCFKEDILLKDYNLIDTMTDLPYPPEMKTRKLTYLAYEHNVVFMPAHRALIDCLMCTEILFKYDIQFVLEYMKSPMMEIRAEVPPPWESGHIERKKLAYENGFRYNPDKKAFTRSLREADFVKIKNNLSIEYDIITFRQKEFNI